VNHVIGTLKQYQMDLYNATRIKNGVNGKDAEHCPINEYKRG
jgi:hypothetical protein